MSRNRTLQDLKGKHIGYRDLRDNPKGGVHKQGEVMEIGPKAVRIKDALGRMFWVPHDHIDWVLWFMRQWPLSDWLNGGKTSS